MVENNSGRILFSVIIPINKMRRDYKNLENIMREANGLSVELVFVLDTSEDLAYEMLASMCQTYNLNDYKILENHKRNPGSSKNLGILNALGDWILFCDSDDYPNLKTIAQYLLSITSNIDIVIGAYEVENLQNSKLIEREEKKSNFNWESISINPGLWRWLIRRQFLTDITFPELSMGEDQCFVIRLLVKNPRVDFSAQTFYRYRIGVVGSLTSSKNNIYDLEEVINLEFLCKPLSQKNLRIRNQMIIKQISTLILRGNFQLKMKGLIHFIKIMTIISPKEYVHFIRYISLILMNRGTI